MEPMRYPHPIRMLVSTRITRSRQRDRTMSQSAARRPRSGIRPCPATGIPCPPSPAGAPSGATSTQPPPTASPHSTPSAAPSRESPGYHHSPHSPDTSSRDPVNGHNQRAAICGNSSGTPIWARIGHIRPEWQVTGAAEHRACCKGRTGSAVLLRRRAEGPVRKDLGPWRVLRRRGGLTNDRGPQADAEERIRSAHRAIEIREKRRRVLSSLCLDLPCAPADVERERRAGHRARHRLVERRTPLSARHRWSWARHITTYRTAAIVRRNRPGADQRSYAS